MENIIKGRARLLGDNINTDTKDRHYKHSL
jgi:hypothetical protein